MTPEQYQALCTLISYVYDDEKKDFESGSMEDGHIFDSIRELCIFRDNASILDDFNGFEDAASGKYIYMRPHRMSDQKDEE